MTSIPPERISEILESGLRWLRYENETSILFPKVVPTCGDSTDDSMPQWKRCLRWAIVCIGDG